MSVTTTASSVRICHIFCVLNMYCHCVCSMQNSTKYEKLNVEYRKNGKTINVLKWMRQSRHKCVCACVSVALYTGVHALTKVYCFSSSFMMSELPTLQFNTACIMEELGKDLMRLCLAMANSILAIICQ